MAHGPVTRISRPYPDRVDVRGRDLVEDVMGRLSFSEYFHLLLTGDEPTEDQRFFLDLLLVAIAEHGMMPTNVTARITLAADPGSLQGAVAAGILGCGPVILGTSEACARVLELADERGVSGAHVELARDLRDAVAGVWGRPLTMNVALPIAAVMLDLGFPSAAVKGIPILARTAGLLAHLAEEQQRPLGFLMASAAEDAVRYEPPPPRP